MKTQMDETFATALREVLIEQVKTTTQRPRSWSARYWVGAIGVCGALIAGGGGLSFALGVWNTPPGGTVVTKLGTAVRVTGSGSQTVELGSQPDGTNSIYVTFSCLSSGKFKVSDNYGSLKCGTKSVPVTSFGTVPAAPGQDAIHVTTDAGQRWQMTATYSKAVMTQWGVNANGQTYGTQNARGFPDLVAAIATNGRTGYLYAKQVNGPEATNPKQALAVQRKSGGRPHKTIPVYESNGKTVVGEFRIGG